MSKYGSLEWTIMNHIKIKQSRKETVFRILNDNGIVSMDDLADKPIPFKDLTSNEIRYLDTIKRNVLQHRSYIHQAMEQLRSGIGMYASPHEQTRIFNLLIANKIMSEELLYSTSNKKLAAIKGIGPKSIDILLKVKQLFASCRKQSLPTNDKSSEWLAMPLTLF